jgi:hypothetical protein
MNLSQTPHIDMVVGRLVHTNFHGIGSVKGDSGFAPEFQDDHWYQECWGEPGRAQSVQIGHFLTAINMSSGGLPFLALMMAHEQSSDVSGQGMVLVNALKGTVSGKDVAAFKQAVAFDGAGEYGARDASLHSIFDPYGPIEQRVGNSMEDLRLDVRAYRLSQMIASGSLQTNVDVANWIALNVGGGQ